MSKEVKEEKLQRIRHSFAHVMAEAVMQIFPDAKIAIGPFIQNGFYYDFDLSRALSPEDLDDISDRMKTIIAQNNSFEEKVVSKAEALNQFSNQPYKLELINDLPENEQITLYSQGEFIDLCRGPHVESAGKLNPNSFKLQSIAGAYWRGDEKRPMLQRIYATAWTNPKDLRLYLQQVEEAQKRDHRKLGRELDLFSMHEEAGAGLAYWHPKGAKIRIAIENFWREQHSLNGYEMVFTPHIGKSWLWETSGHLDFYKEGMYPKMVLDNADYYTKPMNCPFHIMIYNNKRYSYRDLPCRWAELGTVYRYERAGALNGLFRVRGFTQDDAHLICTPGQIEDEIREVLRFSISMLKNFGFTEFKAYISTKPVKSVGRDEDWDAATASLKNAIDAENLEYEIDEGGGAFYGPKIDIKIKDALGRAWQLSTIQFDFNLPNRFDMSFIDKDGESKRPYMIHRALLGSIERFFGILVEHYAGAFPVWLAPEIVRIIPVAEAFETYAQDLKHRFKAASISASADFSSDRMNAKIRKAAGEKIPYILIVGERELESDSVNVRTRGVKQNKMMSFDDFLTMVRTKVVSKELI